MGHLVQGDGADTISQSWNVPGSLNLSHLTFSRLPDKVCCNLRGFLFYFVFLYLFHQRHVRWFPLLEALLKALEKS